MRNIKLVVEYDGSRYCGWQVQPNRRTIQGEIESATQHLFGAMHRITAAGRTDTGVHAFGQVANFRTDSDLDLISIRLGLNSYLPDDIVVHDAAQVADEFHARHDAVSREYKYVISQRLRAIGRQYAWYCRYNFDFSKVVAASKHLLGSHAFTAFSRVVADEPHYLCDVYRLDWLETSDGVEMEICANRFLHNMIRIIVGTLIDVGRGKLQADDVGEILATEDRARAGGAAPAEGLFLMRVNYE